MEIDNNKILIDKKKRLGLCKKNFFLLDQTFCTTLEAFQSQFYCIKHLTSVKNQKDRKNQELSSVCFLFRITINTNKTYLLRLENYLILWYCEKSEKLKSRKRFAKSLSADASSNGIVHSSHNDDIVLSRVEKNSQRKSNCIKSKKKNA